MMFRRLASITIMCSFMVMLVTGLLSYLQPYSRGTATLHTVFGIVFSLGVFGHIINNIKPLQQYISSKWMLSVGLALTLLFAGAYMQLTPIKALMDTGAKLKASSESIVDDQTREYLEMSTNGEIDLTIDLLAGKHYWHPQMAVWIENENGEYIETIFVSKATAQGLFYGGRSKSNFKEFDTKATNSKDYRRVNALPIWSHQRNIKYHDGMYVPTQENPLPDGITGATLQGNFVMATSGPQLEKMILKIEINVAFDNNEYYSEFDFPEDSEFHAGTGQLGQPSVLYAAEIIMDDDKEYYLMELIGRGHHSAKHGEILTDLSSLTTAKEIVERIVVKATPST